MGERVVFHVDMDAFYAAVEMRDDPRLRNVPVVVGADPRGGRGRGVVCTANYAARKYGIRSAMPISQAWRLAPHATYIRPDFSKYGPASEAVMGILERYADVLEVVGMDEAYLDVTQRARAILDERGGTSDAQGGHGPDMDLWDAALDIARSLQAAVKRETQLSCSIGVAPSKSVAKVASDRRKPHGITRVRPDEVVAFLAPLPSRALPGCGPKTAALLADHDIRSIGDIAATPVAQLEPLLGSHAHWLHHAANGRDTRPVYGDHGPRKSRGNESTFFTDQKDADKVLRTATDLLGETLEHHSRRDRRAFATLTVKLRYADFTTLTRAHTSQVPYDVADEATGNRAQQRVVDLLRPLLDGRAVRLVGIRLSGFLAATGQRLLSTYGVAWTGLVSAASVSSVAGERPQTVKPSGAFDPGGLRWGGLDVGTTAVDATWMAPRGRPSPAASA